MHGRQEKQEKSVIIKLNKRKTLKCVIQGDVKINNSEIQFKKKTKRRFKVKS